MPYDAELADRVRDVLGTTAGLAPEAVTEKRMFGGLAFLVEDYLCVAVSHRGGLMLRVDPGDEEPLLSLPRVEEVVMRGRPVTGWLRVHAEGCAEPGDLRGWVARGVGRAQGLAARQQEAQKRA